jgi:hypothetical protein
LSYQRMSDSCRASKTSHRCQWSRVATRCRARCPTPANNCAICSWPSEVLCYRFIAIAVLAKCASQKPRRYETPAPCLRGGHGGRLRAQVISSISNFGVSTICRTDHAPGRLATLPPCSKFSRELRVQKSGTRIVDLPVFLIDSAVPRMCRICLRTSESGR